MSRDCRKAYKCPTDKVCNPSSGRCVNTNGTIGRNIQKHIQQPVPLLQTKTENKPCKAKCSNDQICNPKTGRCVSRAGTIGKKLIGSNKPLIEEKKIDLCKDKNCGSDKVCNPKTGRCVAKNGLVGRKLEGSTQVSIIPDKTEQKSSIHRKIDYLIGPVRLAHVYSGKYYKNIYLFGDEHLRAVKCPPSASNKSSQNIVQFIENTILLNPKKTIDIYLEYSFISAKYPVRPSSATDNYLSDVNKSLDSCAQISKNMCKYPNVRVHYINVRKTVSKVKVLNEIMHYAFDSKISRLTKLNQKETAGLFPINNAELLSLTKIDKQLKAIRDPCLRNYLEQYILDEMQSSSLTITDWENIRDHTSQSKHSTDKIIRLLNALMEGYLLTRMFRSYTRSREGRSSLDSMFNIVYTGDSHISNYLRVFSNLKFYIVEGIIESKKKGTDMQCLDISKYYQPFFQALSNSTIIKELEDSFGKDVLNMVPAGYKIVSKIGSGIAGHVYLASDENFNQVVLKIVKTERNTVAGTHKGIEHEFKMQQKFASVGLAPAPLSLHFYHPRADRNDEIAVMIMERIYGTVGYLIDSCILDSSMIDQIVSQIETIIKKMCKEGLIHGDFHPWNMGYNLSADGSIKITLIDMAYSCCAASNGSCDPRHELSKLIQVLFKVAAKDKNKITRTNCQNLIKPIQELMLHVFKINSQLVPENERSAYALARNLHYNHQTRTLTRDIDRLATIK